MELLNQLDNKLSKWLLTNNSFQGQIFKYYIDI